MTAKPPQTISIRVRYAETDKMGVVYHANYFMWFEIGRCELLRAVGRSYRDMEASGIGLPVIEAHCEYKSPARYDDELVVKTRGNTAVAGARRVRVRNQPPERRNHQRRRPHRSCGRRHERAPVPAARLHSGAAGMKAVVTGAAGFIGSHLSAALLDSGATVTGIDCFTDYYARPLKEANLATLQGTARDSPSSRARCRTSTSGLRSPEPPMSSTWPPRPGCRKSWGRDFDVYTRDNVEATQRLLEALAGMPIQKYVYSSSSSVYGDHVPLPMREDAYLQPLSPYGVSKLAANIWGISTGRTTACRPCRCGISPCTARDSGRIWGFSGF